MPSKSFIHVKQLSRYFHQLCAVDKLNFELRQGEILGFLGANGAGKSTTLKMLCGALAPSDGEITIRGVNLLTDPRQAKSHIGYLPERAPLYLDMKVDEYLLYCAELRQVKAKYRANAVKNAKTRCALNDVATRLIGHLSKGYQQRVGIAQAIVHDPSILILDEPSAGLDPIQIHDIRRLIRSLGQDRSVLISSHILPEVQSVCDRVQIIHQGRLALSASIEDLQQRLRAHSLLFALRANADIELISRTPGVTKIDKLESNRFRIHFEQQNPAEKLAQLAVERGWGLQQLHPEQRSLEDIFLEITGKDSVVTEDTNPSLPRFDANAEDAS
jgi:gliding motility-associated transport system ATP-binding protein